jgi:hypothetical protein
VIVSISIDKTGEQQYLLSLECTGQAPVRILITPRSSFDKIGSAFRDTVRDQKRWGALVLDQSVSSCAELLDGFASRGSAALVDLLGDDSRLRQIRTFFAKLYLSRGSPETPKLVFKTPNAYLPIELMPLMAPSPDFVSFTNKRELLDAASDYFPALRFAIRRVTTGTTDVSNGLLEPDPRDGKVAMIPYAHMDFSAFEERISHLKFTQISVRSAVPDDDMILSPSCGPRIAKLLVEGDGQHRAAIVHVTAHGLTEGSPYDQGLLFGGTGFMRNHEVRLPLHQLKRAIADREANDEQKNGPMALLSACGTANFTFESPTSIPETLLDARYRAVIAPLVAVQLTSAMEVATLLFEGIDEFQTIGESLVSTRRQLLGANANPLALLYVCHGDSDLKIASPPSLR